MGTTESKNAHRYRLNKHLRYKPTNSIIHQYKHKNNQPEVLMTGGKKDLLKRNNEIIVPLLSSSPLNPIVPGSILHHSFPLQSAHSEMQLIPCESSHHPRNSNPLDYTYDPTKIVYDYQKDMERVDEENRPVLEGLCPDKMYVSTNDLRICDTQRLPPPLRCKTIQGFFRPIPPPQFHQKNLSKRSSFL